MSPALHRRSVAAVLVSTGGLALAWALWLAARGFAGGAGDVLGGWALLGATGHLELRDLLAAWPPFTATWLTGAHALFGTAGAAALAALLAGGIAAAWWASLRAAQFSPRAATGIVALLVANPLFLRAAADGPQALLLVWAAWWLALAMFRLRRDGAINDLILLSVALAVLPFISADGVLLAVAAIPFLLLAVPTALMRRSFASTYLLLLFPLIFSLFSFALVCWIFLDDPIGFLDPDMVPAPGGVWPAAARAVPAAVLGAPVLVALILRATNRGPLRRVAVALLAMLAATALLHLVLVPGQALALASCPAVALSAAAAAAWPADRRGGRGVALLVAAGALAGLGIVAADRSAGTAALRAAIAGSPAARAGDADRRLADFLRGRAGVVFDAARHPRVAAALGAADGLVTANADGFKIMALRQRAAGAWLVVRAPDPAISRDALSAAFPALYDAGAPGYRLVYDRDGWRVWHALSSKDA